MILAALSDSVLWFAAGRDVVDWRSWIPSENLIWNSFADGISVTAPDASEDETSGKKQSTEETDDSAQSTSPVD